MKIGGLQKLTLLDFPGQLAAIVFFKGCNFRCPFCFNRDLVLGKGPTISSRTVLSFLKKRQKLLDGVVITGGEPLLQPDLEKLIREIKALGYQVKLDTNGAFPDLLGQLLGKKLVDFVALDYKASFEKYAEIVGLEKTKKQRNWTLVEAIEKSIKLLIKSNIPFEIRTTIVPGVHDKKTLVQMAKQLKGMTSSKSQIKKLSWKLQNFQPKNCLEPEFEKIKPYSKIKIEKLLKPVKKIIPQVELRGE